MARQTQSARRVLCYDGTMNAPIRPTDATEGATPLAPPPRFVHLKVHSAYSLLEGALPIGKLAKLADKLGYPAVALTDTNNMFGVLEFSDKLAASGIQPIAGVSLAVDFDDRPKDPLARVPVAAQAANRDGLLAFFAMSELGYANLMKLASRAHLGTKDGEAPHVKLADVAALSSGVIALTGGPDGPIDRALGDAQTAVGEARLMRLKEIFGDRLYVEIQRHGMPAEAANEPRLLDLAYRHEVPIVATNECCFAKPDDYEAHDALSASPAATTSPRTIAAG